MKQLFLFIILLTSIGCSNKHNDIHKNGILNINIEKHYPKAELMLQDFVDVEYIILDNSDEYICQGRILDIGESYILVSNYIQDGDIFIFDRKGKGIRKINHLGESGKDYRMFTDVLLDEHNEEILINDAISGKIIVYNLQGDFLRKFSYADNLLIDEMYLMDNDYLLCTLGHGLETPDKVKYAIISKVDGHVAHRIKIPYEKSRTTQLNNDNGLFMIYPYNRILPFQSDWLFSDVSSDTIYKFNKLDLKPYLVRFPEIEATRPETFLFPKVLIGDYYFMDIVKKERRYPKISLVYNAKNNEIFEYTLYNNDYTEKIPINFTGWETKNAKIGYWEKIEADKLITLLKSNKLTGNLQNVAQKLNETSNPVIMLAKKKD